MELATAMNTEFKGSIWPMWVNKASLRDMCQPWCCRGTMPSAMHNNGKPWPYCEKKIIYIL